MNQIDLNIIPEGYQKIKAGELMPPVSYYLYNNHNYLNNIDRTLIINWTKYNRVYLDEKRASNDNVVLFIKPIEKPAPKLEFKEITNINLGDLFVSKKNNNGVIVVEAGFATGLYTLAGFNGLELYSTTPRTKEKMIEYLNISERIFVTNLNDKIKKTIDMGLKMVND